MKTKAFSILLAVLASASMIPVASAQRANGNFVSQKFNTPAATRVLKSVPRQLPETCVSDACCTAKTKIRTAGGRATGITSTKVVTCKATCKIASNDQQATCGKGQRA